MSLTHKELTLLSYDHIRDWVIGDMRAIDERLQDEFDIHLSRVYGAVEIAGRVIEVWEILYRCAEDTYASHLAEFIERKRLAGEIVKLNGGWYMVEDVQDALNEEELRKVCGSTFREVYHEDLELQ